MTPEQKARFRQILDEYDMAIDAINEADYVALDSLIHGEALVAAAKQNLAINKRIMDANRRANAQVRILLNEL